MKANRNTRALNIAIINELRCRFRIQILNEAFSRQTKVCHIVFLGPVVLWYYNSSIPNRSTVCQLREQSKEHSSTPDTCFGMKFFALKYKEGQIVR